MTVTTQASFTQSAETYIGVGQAAHINYQEEGSTPDTYPYVRLDKILSQFPDVQASNDFVLNLNDAPSIDDSEVFENT